MAGAVLGVVLALSGDDDEGGGPPPTTTTTAPVSEAGQELLERLDRARGEDLHVVLSSDPAVVEASGQSLTVELWRTAGGQVRQDLVLTAGQVRTETRSIQGDDGDHFCQRASEQDWVCQEIRSVATEEDRPGGIVEAAAADLQGADVTTTDVEILGRPARCYEIAGATGNQSTLCIGEDGTPLRVAVEGQELTATVVDDDVDGDVFDLPAEPTSTAVTPSTAAS